MKIKSGNKNLMDVDQAIVIGLRNKKDVSLNIQGELSLEEVLDMINTATLELITTFEDNAHQKGELNEDQLKQLKVDIYERTVLGFSLMIDRFHPEGIKSRFNGLTEEAIMKAQDEILLPKQK